MTCVRTLMIVGILTATSLISLFSHNNPSVPPMRPFSEFPLKIAEWKGQPNQINPREYAILGVEYYVLADFYRQGQDNTPINFYLGYYESQKQGDTIHSPKNCLPGAGWNILETGTIDVEIPGKKKPVTLARLLLGKGRKRQVVLYWFHSRGRVISSEYMQKIWLVTDSIFRHRTDGSFVRIVSPVSTDENHTIEVLTNFVQQIFPVLDKYIPS